MRFCFTATALLLCLFTCLSTHANQATTSPLKPFTTDGCSLWLDGTPENPNLWRHCCVAHDLAYWKGGSKAERKQADDEIKACVKTAQGPGMAKYMYSNVRWGGSPYWMNHYRWGYGWNYWDGMGPRGYKTPSPEEQRLIEQAMPAAIRVIEEDARKNPAKPVAPNPAK
ncbi:helicase [Cellvibrio sp. UBA7661]|uniref:helicase n=1 Tax=Cellvibrio sp. UBA7661 TaxID=1946311 RepID=UPI002F358CA3